MMKILIMSGICLVVVSCSPTKPDPVVGGVYDKESMKSLIDPPKNMPCYLQPIAWYADQKAKREMLTGKILSWSPKIAISSGLLELYVEEGSAKVLNARMLTLIRLIVSYAVPNAFAVDINAQEYRKFDITDEELLALQGTKPIGEVSTFTKKEKLALEYALTLSKTPVVLTQSLLNHLRATFTEKEIVAIASLSAKVNYWTRLIEALRVKPAGYTKDPLLKLDEQDLLK